MTAVGYIHKITRLSGSCQEFRAAPLSSLENQSCVTASSLYAAHWSVIGWQPWEWQIHVVEGASRCISTYGQAI